MRLVSLMWGSKKFPVQDRAMTSIPKEKRKRKKKDHPVTIEGASVKCHVRCASDMWSFLIHSFAVYGNLIVFLPYLSNSHIS